MNISKEMITCCIWGTTTIDEKASSPELTPPPLIPSSPQPPTNNPPSTFRIVTWNVLGHIHTHWDAAAHQHTVPNPSSKVSNSTRPLESPTQRTTRHTKILASLSRLMPDVILLQEVDSHFPLPIPGYTAHRTENGRGEGTAVLLFDQSFVLDGDMANPVVRLGACREHGWKSSTVVHARRRAVEDGTTYAFCSVHLRHNNAFVQNALLESTLSATSPDSVRVLAGDFNLERALISEVATPFEKRNMVRVPIPTGPTTLGCCSREEPGFRIATKGEERLIDHVWVDDRDVDGSGRSRLVVKEGEWEVGTLPDLGKEPRGPWGDRGGDGSDHAWIRVDMSVVER